MSSRSIVIGDIHGCSRALEALIESIKLTANDLVVVLGDAIDRGPDSRKVLDLLFKLSSTCELVYIRGNHEEMMLDAIEGHQMEQWLKHGGAATVASYRGNINNIPANHLLLLKSTVRYWEGATDICVHANLHPDVELSRQRSYWLRWKKITGDEQPHPSGKRVICGHSGVGYGAPTVRNGWVCLDTNASSGGILSALQLETGEILQARQTGDFRRGVFLHDIEANC